MVHLYNIEEHWLNQLLPKIQYWVVAAKIYWLLHTRIIDEQRPILIIKQFINHNLASWSIKSEFIIDIFLDFFLLDGDIDKIVQLSKLIQTNVIKYFAILGIADFLQGNTPNALINFDMALKAIKDISSKRNICLSGTYGICHILSLLQENNANCLEKIQILLNNYQALEILYYKEKEIARYNHNKELPKIAKYFSSCHQISYSFLAILTRFLEIGSAGIDQEIARVLQHTDRKISSAVDDFILFLLLYSLTR